MRVRAIIAGLVLAAAAGVWASAPNIVVVLTDDIGLGDISCLNPQSGFQTPAVDALAKEGTVFRHAHSAAAICGPSRYSLLSGNYSFRGRLPGGVMTHCVPSQFRSGQLSLAEVLRAAGYRTAFFGKYHAGMEFHSRVPGEMALTLRDADLARPMVDGPRDKGFDYSLTLPEGIQHSPHAFFENDRLARWNSDRNAFDVFESDADARRFFAHRTKRGVTEDQIEVARQDNFYMDNYHVEQVGPILTFKALEYLDRHAAAHSGQPFFMHFCSEAAHVPFAPPADLSPRDPDDYDKPGRYPVKGQTPTDRSDMVYESSLTTGLLVEKLKALGLYENTIFIYASDNGAAQNPDQIRWVDEEVFKAREKGVRQYLTQSNCWDDPAFYCFKWGWCGGNRVDAAEYGRTGRVLNPQGVTEQGRPLKGQKGDVYEGGHRVPLIIRGPGIRSGVVDGRLVGLHDLFATLCELAGVTVPDGQAMDSVSFKTALTEESSTPGRSALMGEVARVPMACQQEKVAALIKQNEWVAERDRHGAVVRLSGEGVPDHLQLCQLLEGDRMARAFYLEEDGCRWKLVVTAGRMPDDYAAHIQLWELYELNADAVEAVNRLDDPAAQPVKARMLEQLKELLK